MRRFAIIGAIILAVLALFVGLVRLRLRADRPEALIARLETARGAERDQLLLRLSLARGDVAARLVDAYRGAAAPDFRAELLDLLFRRNLREPDERLAALAGEALGDPAPAVRRAAAYGLAAYAEPKTQARLAKGIGDRDPQVRRQAYALFASGGYAANNRGAFGLLPGEERTNLVRTCVAQMKTETDPELAFLARSVVGRQVTILCEDAMQSVVGGDVLQARALIESALALDPGNQQAQVRLARLYLATGDPGKALETARRYGALIEIPRLSKAPVIDGDPTDDVWREAFATETFYHTTSGYVAKRTTGKSRCCCGYRDGRIYVAMLGFEDDLDKLVIRHKNRDEEVYLDDCVELIFNPGSSEKDYCQFIINPLGAMNDNKSGDNKVNFNCEYKTGVFKDRGYWAVEFAIDAKELTPTPIASDTIWSLNFFRARIGAASEHGCIWPMYGYALRAGLYPLAVFKDAPATR